MIDSSGTNVETGETGAREAPHSAQIPSFVEHSSQDGIGGRLGPGGPPAPPAAGMWFPRRTSTFLDNLGPARVQRLRYIAPPQRQIGLLSA